MASTLWESVPPFAFLSGPTLDGMAHGNFGVASPEGRNARFRVGFNMLHVTAVIECCLPMALRFAAGAP